jgi:Rap1a immunity proteins
MFKITLFAVLSCVVLSLPLSATDLNGCRLLLKCEADVRTMGSSSSSDNDLIDANYCMGLVRGVDAASPYIDSPSDVSLGQEVRVVVLYLQTHPEELNKPDVFLVNRALSKAWPSKNQGQ